MRELLSWRLLAPLSLRSPVWRSWRSRCSPTTTSCRPSSRRHRSERTIDLIAPVIAPLPSDDFEVDDDGVTVGYLDLLLPGDRTMRIAPGTPGEVDV